MADLITRILLDDKQFNDNIAKSKQKTESFDKAFSTIKSSVTKFAGALGVATTAGATFMKIIESSDSKSDNFHNTMNAAKTSVDQFFKSIATGDFSNFINGLDDVYRKAWATQAALDQLGDTQISFSLVSSKTRSKIAGARADAFDTELSAEERKNAIKDWKDGINEIGEATKVLQNDINAVMQTTASTFNALLPENIDPVIIESILSLNTSENRDAIKDKADADFKTYQDELKSIAKANRESITIQSSAGAISKDVVSSEGKRLQTEAAERYKEAILIHSIWEKMTEDERKSLQELTSQYYSLSEAISANEMQINRAIPRLEKQINGKDGKDIIPSGSIADVEEKIKEAKKAFANATTDEARTAADLLITQLEAKKVRLSVEFKFDDPGKVLPGGTPQLKTGGKLAAIQEIQKLESEITKAENSLIGLSDPTRIKKLNSEIKTLKENVSLIKDANNLNIGIPDMSSVFKNNNNGARGWIDIMGEMGEINNDMASSINAISSALDNEAGAWLQWGANVLSSIGQAIPAIMALTAVKQTENTVNAAGSMIKGSNSVAGIPIVGPILAIAAIASIGAALMSMPKFAYGGIVGGNSFSGDNLLARVNSGEMILNSTQQSNLFDMIKIGGSARGELNINVTGELRGSGKDFIGVISNQMAKQNRG